MRSLILSIILAILSTGIQAQVSSPQAAFDSGNTYFQDGDFVKALNQYRSIERSGQVSGALFLNMGIAAAELDSFGLAKAYLLKAKDFDETLSESERALQYVNTQFSRRSAVLPKLPWDLIVDWMIGGPGVYVVFFSGFGFLLIGMSLLFGRWFGRFKDVRFKKIAISIIGVGIIVISLSFYADYVDQRYQEAVLIDDSSRVLDGPEESAVLVSMAYEGYDLSIDHYRSRQEEGWYYIRLGNGQFGWISDKGIKLL